MPNMKSACFKPVKAVGILAIVTLVASSCATKGDLRIFRDEIQVQNNQAEIRLSSIEWSITMLDSLIRDQNRSLQGIRALSGTQAQEQRDDISIIMARQEDINYQLREITETLRAIQLYGGVEIKEPQLSPAAGSASQQSPVIQQSPAQAAPSVPIQQTPAASTAVQTPAASPESDNSESLGLFESALTDLRDGNYLLAESLFLSYLMQYPSHEMAPDAQFWLGEAAYGQGKHDLAVSEFRKVIDKYPSSTRIPSALLRIGEIQMERGDMINGTETLNRLITSYPGSDETARARNLLNAP